MIEVLKQMVEALEWCHGGEPIGTAEAIKAGKQAIAELESQEPVAWIEGYPKAHYAEEWFIAKLNDGDRVVLQALPEEFKHDFTTRDGTYFLKESIKSWMQFPDTEFLPPPQRTWVGLTDEEIKTICSENGWDSSWQSLCFARAIEAKLKERNL